MPSPLWQALHRMLHGNTHFKQPSPAPPKVRTPTQLMARQLAHLMRPRPYTGCCLLEKRNGFLGHSEVCDTDTPLGVIPCVRALGLRVLPGVACGRAPPRVSSTVDETSVPRRPLTKPVVNETSGFRSTTDGTRGRAGYTPNKPNGNGQTTHRNQEVFKLIEFNDSDNHNAASQE